MKIRIIELLEMIANGQKPPKKILIRFKDIEERIVGEETFEYAEKFKDYFDEHNDRLFEDYDWIEILNEEVEILETTITYNANEKIKKIDLKELNENMSLGVKNDIYLAIKINEIIEAYNER